MNPSYALPRGLPYRTLLGGAGAIVAVCGIALWGYLLLTPVSVPAPALAPKASPTDATATVVSKWFTPGPAKVELAVEGIMFTRSRATAMISIDGAPARAYLAGDKLGHSITLQRIEHDGVVLDQAGSAMRVEVPRLPEMNGGGIERVR